MQGTQLQKITLVSTVCDMLNAEEGCTRFFQEYVKIINLYLTIPVKTASAARIFSTLNRLKTCLRETVGLARLNYMLITYIYTEKPDQINQVAIYDVFIRANERRQTFFFGLLGDQQCYLREGPPKNRPRRPGVKF